MRQALKDITIVFYPFEGWQKAVGNGHTDSNFDEMNKIFDQNKAETKSNAMKFINAVYSYIHHPEWSEPEDSKVFEKAVKDYQIHRFKKAIPEEARKYFLQADAAANDKSYLEAMEL